MKLTHINSIIALVIVLFLSMYYNCEKDILKNRKSACVSISPIIAYDFDGYSFDNETFTIRNIITTNNRLKNLNYNFDTYITFCDMSFSYPSTISIKDCFRELSDVEKNIIREVVKQCFKY